MEPRKVTRYDRYDIVVETTNPNFIERFETAMEWAVEHGALLEDQNEQRHTTEITAFGVDTYGESTDALYSMSHNEHDEAGMKPDMFPAAYKSNWIAAYPNIAEMDPEQMYDGTREERDAAFQRILDNSNLRGSCEEYIAHQKGQH